MSFASEIADALTDLDAEAGVTITYRRGVSEISITAVRGTTAFPVENSEGARIRRSHGDYLIRSTLLDFGSGPVEPRAGDVIVDGTGTFEVGSQAQGQPPWSWSTRARDRYRIHVIEK